MATPKITPFPFPKQVPETIPKPPQEITQGDLSFILATRMEVERLKYLLTEAEASVKARLEAGAAVEQGPHVGTLQENFRKSPGWRDVAERLAERLYGNGRGFGYCEGVLKNTKPTRSVQLVVA